MGPLAVALLAAEVGALTAHLTSRSSAIRAVAVEALLDDYSAVTVANRLGVPPEGVRHRPPELHHHVRRPRSLEESMMAAHEDIREEVTLPDLEVQRLVHPLDLPEARPSFRTGWLIGALTSVPVSALVAAILAYAARSALPPIIAFLALTVLGALAGRWYTDRAWDYIPRNRQDRARPLPRSWELASAGVLALVLGVALLLVVYRLDDPDVPVTVRAFTFGMCLVAAALVLADVLVSLARPTARRRGLAGLPGAAVVVLATVLAWTAWFDGDADTVLLFWGAVTMTAATVLVGATRVWDRRRAAGR